MQFIHNIVAEYVVEKFLCSVGSPPPGKARPGQRTMNSNNDSSKVKFGTVQITTGKLARVAPENGTAQPISLPGKVSCVFRFEMKRKKSPDNIARQIKLRKFTKEFAIHALWALCFTIVVSITRNNTQQFE